ncbi:hypothetical protein OROMI_032335 [Orobanche minor]
MSVICRLGVAARIFSRLRRSYVSAAATQLDYGNYYCYDDEEGPQGKTNHREGMEETDGCETPGRGAQWVVMGDPMVRRHVYAERLAKLLDVPHISMGSLVRQELNPNSPLYKKIASAVNQGNLVPEEVIFGLLSKRLEEGFSRGESGFILDGIPRTRMQAEILDQIADIDLVLNLRCTEECVVNKKTLGGSIYSPRLDLHSMTTSGINLSLETQAGHPCAHSDTLWKKEKSSLFAEQRKPLEEYYKQQKKLLDFQVAGAPGDTWQGLLAALQLQQSVIW